MIANALSQYTGEWQRNGEIIGKYGTADNTNPVTYNKYQRFINGLHMSIRKEIINRKDFRPHYHQ